MKILLSTWGLFAFSGAALFIRDLAGALQARGHHVAVYTPLAGRLARLMRDAGIPVVDRLDRLPFVPDVIHGQHQPALAQALLHFPQTPAVWVTHDARARLDEALVLPRIRRYVAVDERCLARLQRQGVPPPRTRVILNFVDLKRFIPRGPLPDRPRRALVFSNYADSSTHLRYVPAVCARLGLPLDIIGEGSGKTHENPGAVLARYDLVFAKARCAIEAMAVGAAVVLCDYPGLGPMVDTQNFATLRRMNFGAGTLTQPLDEDRIAAEILRYDAADAAEVAHRIRREAGLDAAAIAWENLYREAIEERHAPEYDSAAERQVLRVCIRAWRGTLWLERAKCQIRKVTAIPLAGGPIFALLRRLWRARPGLKT